MYYKNGKNYLVYFTLLTLYSPEYPQNIFLTLTKSFFLYKYKDRSQKKKKNWNCIIINRGGVETVLVFFIFGLNKELQNHNTHVLCPWS